MAIKLCVRAGVLMWEVFTEGRMPFENSQNHEVVTLVTMGHRLYKPKMATPSLYDIMRLCWHEVSSHLLFLLQYRCVVASLFLEVFVSNVIFLL